MNKTKIEWTDYSWSPITGCLGPDGKGCCPYCYARRIANPLAPKGNVLWSSREVAPGCYEAGKGDVFPYGFAPTFYPHRLEEPLKVKKPSRIFVCSMGELFGDWVPVEWQEMVYDTMRRAPWHIFIILTKWPEQMLLRLPWIETPAPNIWHLVSCENQETWDKRVPELLKLRKHGWRVLGVSVEPMLGEIEPHGIENLDWLILGGQSPPSASQPKYEWIRGINSYALGYGLPVFEKKNLRPVLGDNLRQEWPQEPK